MNKNNYPKKQGLYDPQFEKDSCGVGFVCDIKGRKSHRIIEQGLEVLTRLSHRGAVGADPKTGDGAGILIQIPHGFFRKTASGNNIDLPDLGDYGTGLVFLPNNEKDRTACERAFLKIIKQHQQQFLGWRKIGVEPSVVGKTARESCPFIAQIFIGKNKSLDAQAFERKLYVIRRQVENLLKKNDVFYIVSLSSRTFSYKGLLMPTQVGDFFPELYDESIKSALCLVHSRYSTNTFPSWNLSQPFRYLAHNGEINTLRGNINWVSARERLISSELFGKDIEKIKPIITEGGSDSTAIDNIFELLVLSGRSLEHAMMMLVPAAWEHDNLMSDELREFYRYHACFMEPWDGPAAIAFTDGIRIGAILDRNGLRPTRYIVTNDDFMVMASEVGVLNIKPQNIKLSGRLKPGEMFLVDTQEGILLDSSQIKMRVSNRRPYSNWNKKSMVDFDSLVGVGGSARNSEDIIFNFKAFGYTREDLKVIIKPMAENGKEPIGSMGNDTPYAFLSKQPQLFYNYFRQMFAQVTNPAIDPIREKLVMSLESFIGPEENILTETDHHSHKLRIKNPILSDEELAKIRDISINGFRTKTIYTFFEAAQGKEGFTGSLDRVCLEAERAIEDGYSFIILSDRGASKETIALPALLVCSAVHQHLVRKNIRSQVAIIAESAEPREVHHFALLFGYGVDCINPYLAHHAVGYLIYEKEISLDRATALKNYDKAVTNGILKILSKMGISTLRSYRGAQIFESLGLDEAFIEKYFKGTVSRIGGVDLSGIADETLTRHSQACCGENLLLSGGLYQWKRDGEFHLWNPQTIAFLQDATRTNDYSKYLKFAELINDQSDNPTTLRSLFKISSEGGSASDGKKAKAIPISLVEPIESIMTRFVTGAMSFGSISSLAHETIAIAMNRIGGKSNTGEGGEDPNRFVTLPNGDSRRSAIKQVASGRFGVTINYLVNADEIQIKIAQGAKPGEGGQLPGYKVNDVIARTRHTTVGVTLISPPPHHDIYSIEDLAQLIFDLKNANPKARISVKLVSEMGVGTIAAGVAKGHADMILISAGDGGTGASPKSSIRYAGLPWELGLSEAHQTLTLNNLRLRVRLQTDGQMRTGRDVAIAAMLGADEYGFCTAVLIVIGCMMLRHCHLNNCSVGITTQDGILQKSFSGRVEHIVNYFRFVANELREIMASLGVKTLDELVGRTDFLEVEESIAPPKARGIDYSRILYKAKPQGVGDCRGVDNSEILDDKLFKKCHDALTSNRPVVINARINNTNRAVGARLSGQVCRTCGEGALLEDTITCKFRGVAGQSFAAFLGKGITFELEGMSNDYVGKGISGGKVIIYPDRKARFAACDNIIIGNTSFYGAIAGEAYINGGAGERFCVRNSGLYGVVEGVGDHGCEYMTGGRIIVLGETGKNFAAGMSGGIAYVYDEGGDFHLRCNTDMAQLGAINEEDKRSICYLLYNHFKYTQSLRAKAIIDDLDCQLKKIVKVIPVEYKRVLELQTGDLAVGKG
ncbi:MAG: glutamate synthase large subunit [Candidatus Omnitrophica bacterium]|nr:glutamate synthase large subunit [Candidatus Omnitrophota bacterium]